MAGLGGVIGASETGLSENQVFGRPPSFFSCTLRRYYCAETPSRGQVAGS